MIFMIRDNTGDLKTDQDLKVVMTLHCSLRGKLFVMELGLMAGLLLMVFFFSFLFLIFLWECSLIQRQS